MTPRLSWILVALLACATAAGCGSDGKGGSDDGGDSSSPVSPRPLNADKFLAGNAKPADIPDGEADQLSVVETGPPSTDDLGATTLPIIFRNNTGKAVSHVDVSASARDNNGKIVVTGESQGTSPAQLKPGDPALAFIYFDGDAAKVPKDADFKFSFESVPADTSAYNTATVRVKEASKSGNAIVGAGINDTGEKLEGPFSTEVYCFGSAGKLKSVQGGFADRDTAAKDEELTFTVDLFDAKCPKFLVGMAGYYP